MCAHTHTTHEGHTTTHPHPHEGTRASILSASHQNTVITFSEKYSTHTHTHTYTYTHHTHMKVTLRHTHTHMKAHTQAYNQSPIKTQSLHLVRNITHTHTHIMILRAPACLCIKNTSGNGAKNKETQPFECNNACVQSPNTSDVFTNPCKGVATKFQIDLCSGRQ